MKWTKQQRLNMIKAIAAMAVDGPVNEDHFSLMQRIMFLCDMPAEFLEKNKRNFEDVIKFADVPITTTL